jgi:hypothetical protein
MIHTDSKVEKILDNLPLERQEPMRRLVEAARRYLPAGFSEKVSGERIEYVVPKSDYPPGYHCDPDQPLPFLSLISQKGHIGFYHMGLYAFPETLEWFREAYRQEAKHKPDMGKSCVRFKKPDRIPYDTLVKLLSRITPKEWIEQYEKTIKR